LRMLTISGRISIKPFGLKGDASGINLPQVLD